MPTNNGFPCRISLAVKGPATPFCRLALNSREICAGCAEVTMCWRTFRLESCGFRAELSCGSVDQARFLSFLPGQQGPPSYTSGFRICATSRAAYPQQTRSNTSNVICCSEGRANSPSDRSEMDPHQIPIRNAMKTDRGPHAAVCTEDHGNGDTDDSTQ